MAGAVYTGGREGSHSVMLCENLGHGVTDIENVPLDQVQAYLDKGYMQCEIGDTTLNGYCTINPEGYNCVPAPIPNPNVPVAQVLPTTHTAVGTPPAAIPTRLPDVGASTMGLLVPLALAIVIGLVYAKLSSKRT